MKLWISVTSTLLLITLVSGASKLIEKDSEKAPEKVSEKIYPKKVTSLKKKPTKSPILKSPIESFKDLSEDDLDFIKELDKQFQIHGDKIKIKVERDNSTSKNSKRTVDGELGYGYYNGHGSGGYEYPKPTFTFYPYSQHDIPPSAPGYHVKNEDQSTFSIIPSYSYELKQNNNENYKFRPPFIPSKPDPVHHSYEPENQRENGPTEIHAQGQNQGHQYNEPVIVLRIPGPTKYASHLQSLLQQYLEIRAAQYIKLFEASELQTQQQYQHPPQAAPVEEKQQVVQYIQQHQEAPQNYEYAAVQQGGSEYPSIDTVYQSFKGRSQDAHQIEDQHYVTQEQYVPQSIQGGEQQQQYYYMQVQQDQPVHTEDIPQGYQAMYYVAMRQPEYVHQDVYAPTESHGYTQEESLPITENNPRPTHTKVLFTESDNKDHSTPYELPSIKPFERHPPPTATPIHEHYQGDTQEEANDYQQPQQQYQQLHGQASAAQAVVTITQRPFNYHAHSMRSKGSKRNTESGDARRKLHTQTQRSISETNIPRRAKKQAV